MYLGPAPLLEIFLAEVLGKHIKRPRALLTNNGRKLENSKSESLRAEGDLKSRNLKARERDGKLLALANNRLRSLGNLELETPKEEGARDGRMLVIGKLRSF